MASLNRVFLIGNLTRDPDIRHIPSGTAVGEFGLAVSRKYRSQTGETKEETCFVDIVVWGRQAEVAEQYLKKGSPLFVEGRLKLDQWETGGEKRSKLRVVADRFQMLGGRRGGSEEYGDAPAEGAGSSQFSSEKREPQDANDEGGAKDAAEGQEDEDNLPF